MDKEERGVCPLLLAVEGVRTAILGETVYGYDNAYCVGPGCAWWKGDGDACAIWAISTHIEELTAVCDNLSETTKKEGE